MYCQVIIQAGMNAERNQELYLGAGKCPHVPKNSSAHTFAHCLKLTVVNSKTKQNSIF